MILVKCRPLTSGTRHKRKLLSVNLSDVRSWIKINKTRKAGRSSRTGILLNKRKSPNLRRYFNINYKSFLINHVGLIVSNEFFFKCRTLVGLVKYSNGAYACIRLANGLIPGTFIKNTNLAPYFCTGFYAGDTVLLEWLESRSVFFNIISCDTKKSIYAKAAGTFCTVHSTDEQRGYTKVELPSGLVKYIYNFTFVTLGRNSNIFRKNYVIGKAGDSVILGRRPSVRGIAMNPVDHPHGGRTKSNSPEKTPWGKVAKFNK